LDSRSLRPDIAPPAGEIRSASKEFSSDTSETANSPDVTFMKETLFRLVNVEP
jgi:hypothetical protein